MEIPNPYIVKDIRNAKDLKGITISGYKRKDVTKTFQNSIINNKLEDAIRWCVELHISCLNSIIWNILKTIYIKYIHINSPKFFIYFLKREKDYIDIINKYPKGHEIYTRNNQEIRNLYSELVAIFTLTKKSNIFLPKSLPTINEKSFEKNDIKQRMIATNTDNIIEFIFNTTTSEMKLALNEIYFNLSSSNGTYENCIYWYLWIEKIESNKKKDKNKNNEIIFANISPENNNKYFDHWIFIIWKIIFNMKNKIKKNNLIYLKKIYNIYKKNFKPSQISQKKYYIFTAFYTIKYKINWNYNIFVQEHLIIQSSANINKMYENVINKIESKLSDETIHKLHKSYKKMYYNMYNKQNEIIVPKKIINNDLNDEINKVLYTKYPDYNFNKNGIKENTENNKKINKNNIPNYDQIISDKGSDNYNINNNQINCEQINYEQINDKQPNKLISTNMTKKDIINSIEEKKNKKLDAFTQFIAFKKKDNNQNSQSFLENDPKEIKEYVAKKLIVEFNENKENEENIENKIKDKNILNGFVENIFLEKDINLDKNINLDSNNKNLIDYFNVAENKNEEIYIKDNKSDNNIIFKNINLIKRK